MMIAKENQFSYLPDEFANFSKAYFSLWWASLRWFAVGSICMLACFAVIITFQSIRKTDHSVIATFLPAIPLTILAILLPASASLLRTLSEILGARQILSNRLAVKRMLRYIVGVGVLFLLASTYALAPIGQTLVQYWSVVGLGALLCIGCAVWGWFHRDKRMPIVASSVPCLMVTLVLMPSLQSHLATKTFTLSVVGTFTVVALILYNQWESKKQNSPSVNFPQPVRRFQSSVVQRMLARRSTRTILLSFSMSSLVSQFVTLAIGFASLQAGSTFSGALLNACVLQVILESNHKIGLLPSLRWLWLPFGLERKSLAFQLFVIRLAQLLFVFVLFAITLAALSLAIDFSPMTATDLRVLPFLLLAIWVLGVSLALWNAAARRSVFWSLVIALILSPLVLYAQYQLGIGPWQSLVVNNHAVRDALLILLCALAFSLIILIHANRLLATKDLSSFLNTRQMN